MTETMVNGAEALLELFRTQGADYIFCSPIAAWAPLWEALAKRKATSNATTPTSAVTEEGVLKHLTPEGVKATDLRAKLKGSEAQILRRLKQLEASGKARRSGERRATRWHKVQS